MLITTLATLVIGQSASLACPVMGSPISGKGSGSFDYNGARFTICCAGCDSAFKGDPGKYMKQAVAKKITIGASLFDPTTGLQIASKEAKGSSDFAGLRYYFASAEGKKAFDADPKKFAVQPKKEVLYCPVMGHETDGYKGAGAYLDSGDTRYYLCCGDCLAAMKKNPSLYTAKVADKVHAPQPIPVKG